MAMHRALRTSHLTAAPRRSFTSATTVALAVLLGACSSGDADPAPSFSGGQAPPGSGGSGSANAPSTSPGSTSNNSTNTNTPSTSQQTASNVNNSESLPTNLPQTNGSAGSGSGSNNNSNNNTNSGTQGSGGAGGAGNNTASGGSAGSASTMGTAGNGTMPPPTGNAGTSGNGSAGAGGNTQPPPDTTPDIACPTGATFCSGFEGTTLPSTSIFQSNPVTQFAFDTTVKHSGSQSLKITSAKSGFNIQEVVVPIPGNAFWARLFIQTSTDFGDNDHDSLFVGSTASTSQDNNAESGPEFSEQGNQILINADDKLYAMGGPGFPQGKGPQLTANTWHCIEAHYDGGSGDVEYFSDGTQLINAAGFLKTTYQTFRFGYIEFNTPRTIWFDDVVVAPDRVGCN
jgi:hypothetical protein